jgi:methyl-accepting chemotaxis protein
MSAWEWDRAVISQMEEQQTPAIREWLRSCPVVPPDMLCGDLADLFRRNAETECAVVCDAGRRPLGLLMKHRFFRLLGSAFGVSLYATKEVSYLMERNSYTAEMSISPRELIDGALSRKEDTFYDAVIITEQGKLAGILTVSDLLRLSRLLQKEAAGRQIRTARRAEEMIGQIAQAGKKVAAASHEMRACHEEITESVERGRQDLEGMLQLFRQWSDHAGLQEKAMNQLTERAAAVNQIAALIAELADQCNLLAVNAAIEAARAKEHGRGFGVVAQEIRALADSTKRSAGEIHRMLQTMTEAVEDIVSLVQDGKRGAGQGVVQIRHTEETLASLWASSARSKQAVGRLLQASGEAEAVTDDVIREIGRLVAQMNGGSA